MLKQAGCFEPSARIASAAEQFAAPIFLRRETGEVVISTLIEEALEEEVVLQGFGVFCHVPRRSIDIAQRLVDVLRRRNAVCIGTESLGQTLSELADRCIGLRRSGADLAHCVIELLGQLTLLNINDHALHLSRSLIQV